MTARPALDPDLPYEAQLRRHRTELWTAAGTPDWQQRRRAAAAWLVAWREAGEDLVERTEARIARDESRVSSTD